MITDRRHNSTQLAGGIAAASVFPLTLLVHVMTGGLVLHRVLFGLAAALVVAGAALADDADLCADDGVDLSARVDACTRLARTGKYRNANLAAVYNNRGIAYRRQNE